MDCKNIDNLAVLKIFINYLLYSKFKSGNQSVSMYDTVLSGNCTIKLPFIITN